MPQASLLIDSADDSSRFRRMNHSHPRQIDSLNPSSPVTFFLHTHSPSAPCVQTPPATPLLAQTPALSRRTPSACPGLSSRVSGGVAKTYVHTSSPRRSKTSSPLTQSQLGVPTANIPAEGLSEFPDLQVGVYYGVVALDPAKFESAAQVLPAVLSIGYNPFYKNKTRSIVCPSLLSLAIAPVGVVQ